MKQFLIAAIMALFVFMAGCASSDSSDPVANNTGDKDSTQSGNDGTAGNDSTNPGDDSTNPGNDSTNPGNDSTNPGNDVDPNTPDTTPPQVTSFNPANGDKNISTNPLIYAIFNEDLDTLSVQGSIVLKEGTTEVAGTINYLSDERKVLFTPAAALKPETTYAVTLNPVIKDKAGNSLAKGESWSFTTGKPPKVIGFTPENGATDVSLKEITIEFDQDMDATSITEFTIMVKKENETIPMTITTASKKVILTPKSIVKAGNYTVTVTTGVRATTGMNLDKEYSWSFSTPVFTSYYPSESENADVPMRAHISFMVAEVAAKEDIQFSLTKNGTPVAGTLTVKKISDYATDLAAKTDMNIVSEFVASAITFVTTAAMEPGTTYKASATYLGKTKEWTFTTSETVIYGDNFESNRQKQMNSDSETTISIVGGPFSWFVQKEGSDVDVDAPILEYMFIWDIGIPSYKAATSEMGTITEDADGNSAGHAICTEPSAQYPIGAYSRILKQEKPFFIEENSTLEAYLSVNTFVQPSGSPQGLLFIRAKEQKSADGGNVSGGTTYLDFTMEGDVSGEQYDEYENPFTGIYGDGGDNTYLKLTSDLSKYKGKYILLEFVFKGSLGHRGDFMTDAGICIDNLSIVAQ